MVQFNKQEKGCFWLKSSNQKQFYLTYEQQLRIWYCKVIKAQLLKLSISRLFNPILKYSKALILKLYPYLIAFCLFLCLY